MIYKKKRNYIFEYLLTEREPSTFHTNRLGLFRGLKRGQRILLIIWNRQWIIINMDTGKETLYNIIFEYVEKSRR